MRPLFDPLLALRLQMLQRAVTLAAESLKVLEHQLTDGGQTQDVKVGGKSPPSGRSALAFLPQN